MIETLLSSPLFGLWFACCVAVPLLLKRVVYRKTYEDYTLSDYLQTDLLHRSAFFFLGGYIGTLAISLFFDLWNQWWWTFTLINAAITLKYIVDVRQPASEEQESERNRHEKDRQKAKCPHCQAEWAVDVVRQEVVGRREEIVSKVQNMRVARTDNPDYNFWLRTGCQGPQPQEFLDTYAPVPVTYREGVETRRTHLRCKQCKKQWHQDDSQSYQREVSDAEVAEFHQQHLKEATEDIKKTIEEVRELVTASANMSEKAPVEYDPSVCIAVYKSDRLQIDLEPPSAPWLWLTDVHDDGESITFTLGSRLRSDLTTFGWIAYDQRGQPVERGDVDLVPPLSPTKEQKGVTIRFTQRSNQFYRVAI